ncbi:sister chromatid separation protein (Src1) [Ophiocordyceps camponoti-floridani]|uniref:Sister chromatid separation protein (Src1) n=1 Tax=Ophiocordyceps camponoti-floridani TaxID=2030778 RepID=A0A8H4VDJ1_9HYPO|nr:sister chromatid separation protein (Src1) [Ophiocordyceps camponoti-floridani]
MVEGEDYLQEGFDPRSVTMPRLRSILVTHSIDFPSTAKKAQLVELVTDRVLPQVPRLRSERAKAKRSSFGIVNAGSADDTNTWDDTEMQPPRTASKRSRSPVKSSTRRKTIEPEVEPPLVKSSRKSSSRSASRPPDDDDATAGTKSKRRIRRTITPQIKAESDEERPRLDELQAVKSEEESVFTDDNPFQSGSSPPATKSANQRRRTAGDELFKDIVRPSGRRSEATSRKSSAMAMPPFQPEAVDEPLEPGEEFTPNEQLELERAERAGEISIAPRKPRQETGRRTSFRTPLLALMMALLSAYGAWYRQEKMAVGYCGLGRPAKTMLPPEVPVPNFLQPFVEVQCEPCPLHAYCYQDYSVRCEPDFILQPHPLSLGGLVPLPPSCEPDGEKARRVQAVADKAVEELRERRAKFECGTPADDEGGQQHKSPAMSEDELKESVGKKRSKRLSQVEFDELWKAAIGEVTARDEVSIEKEAESVEMEADPPIPHFFLASNLRLPHTLDFPSPLLAQTVFYLRSKYRRHRAASAQVPGLVDAVLGRLADQKELGDEDLDDSWLFLPNLRDDVLRNVHSLSERESIWRRVRRVVEQNSNVRTGQREGRSGEVGRAWEWIGPVKGEGARRRRSGRVSWAPESAPETPENVREMVETKRWDEPRPYY